MGCLWFTRCRWTARLQNVVPVQVFQKLPDVRSHYVDVYAAGCADLIGDLPFVRSVSSRSRILEPINIQTEDLASFDIQKDSAVRCLSSSNRVWRS